MSTAPVVTAPIVTPIAPDPTDSPGVVERINGFATRTRAAEELAAGLQRQLAEATAGRVAAERNAALIGTGIKAPSVQRALRRGYDDYAAEAGATPLPFGEWIEAEARVDPLFSPHFVAPAGTAPIAVAPVVTPAAPVAAAPVAPVLQTPAPANPNNGTVATPVAQGHIFTDAEVSAMDDATWRLNSAAIKQQMSSGAGGGMPVRLPEVKKSATGRA